jgi:AcrR family transcriptional regulator
MAAPASVPRRLTRAEQKARTRASLLESAEKVFARRGMEHASIDEVAQAAGFTKGAFYANFESKEELFLAMLDRHFAEHAERIDRTMATDQEPEEQAREGGVGFMREIASDPEWERLFFEFAAYAARNDTFRAELVARYRGLRDRMAELYERRAGELGVEPPIPVEQIATMTFAMANGVALQKLLDPDAVPEDLYATMLVAFFGGLRAMVEAESPTGSRQVG